MLKNESNEWVNLYNAYNLQAICKTATYKSIVFQNEYDVITDLCIFNTKTKEILWNHSLGNNFAKLENVSNCIDNILFYFNHEKLDSYSINKTIDDVICHNDCSLFNMRIERRKQKLEKEQQIIKQVAENTVLQDEIKELCNVNSFEFYQGGSSLYIIKFNDEKTKNHFSKNIINGSILKDKEQNILENNLYNANNEYEIIYKSDNHNTSMYNNNWMWENLENVIDAIKIIEKEAV